MVSKLLLAVQECCLKAIEEKASKEVIGRLLEHYYEINEGIGVHKSPELYGAFPTDPYSHTPAGKGAQQPGMTGQVKEDILSRFGELGVRVIDGEIRFAPDLLRKDEFLKKDKVFKYIDIDLASQEIPLQKGSLCFTYCQVPIIYKLTNVVGVEVNFRDGSSKTTKELRLDKNISKTIFERKGDVNHIVVSIKN